MGAGPGCTRLHQDCFLALEGLAANCPSAGRGGLGGAGRPGEEQVLEAAHNIETPSAQAHALREIAEALAGPGRWEQYLAVACSIADDSASRGTDEGGGAAGQGR